MRYATAVLAVWAALGFLGAGAAQAVELTYGHTAGLVLGYELTLDDGIQVTTADLRRTVTAADADTVTVVTAMGNVRVDRGGIVTVVSSGLDDVARTVMDRHGTLTSVEALGNFAGTASGLGVDLRRDVFASLGVSSFPAGDLAVGSTWTKDAEKDGATATFTYRITQLNTTIGTYTTVAVIEMSSAFTMTPQVDIPSARTHTLARLDVTVTGNIYFDVNTGRVVRVVETVTQEGILFQVGYGGKVSIHPVARTVNATLAIQ
ncbi:hypothetical protein [Deferrisoma sp.]